jgi:hypothetical protein
VEAAAIVVVTLLGWAVGIWLGLWLNGRLKLGPWPGAHWATRVMQWSIRCLVFLTAFLMISAPVTYFAAALLG